MLLHRGLFSFGIHIILQMPLNLHRFLQALAGLVCLFCGLGIINTMVSFRYEIKDNDCVSVVNGRDLCRALYYSWIGLGGAAASIVALAFVKIKLAKPNN